MYIAIRDNRGKWPVHIYKLASGESSQTAVARFQRNLARMTPGGANGVTWTMLDAKGVVDAMIEGEERIGK